MIGGSGSKERPADEQSRPKFGGLLRAMPSSSSSLTGTQHLEVMSEEDKKATEAELYSIIREGLMEMMVSKKSSAKGAPTPRDTLRIKAEYRGEKFCIEMRRPVRFEFLESHLSAKYSRQLNIYYTLSNSELIVPIRNQLELDRAIELLDRSPAQRSLRLVLSRHHSDSGISSCSASTTSTQGSFMPDASGTFSSSPSKIIEIPYSECRSSCASSSTSRWRGARSGGGSSASSGVVLPDYDNDERRSANTPRAPTNWKQGKCIGSGAFGQVFLCYDVDTGKEIALKRLHFARGDTHLKKQVVQLENEINLLSTIQHKRIVQYLGVQRTDESISIFMEYMAGGSVKDLISTYGPLSSAVARKYTYQVLQGLAYLHRNDMIHRDIKSANILRDSDGNVKIGDFGSAKRLQTICSQQSASFIGTPHYMAPEVVLGKSAYGRKADIWSVGCTLLEMLTGAPPWHGLEPMAVIFNIAYQHPKYQLPPSTESTLSQLLTVLLERAPDKRPSAVDLLNNHPAFRQFLSIQ
uniref:Protein kinase domain-containing protein n=1 Tax=Parascaris univalens TaxID=6257 RepID=A0A915AFT3_PARUN